MKNNLNYFTAVTFIILCIGALNTSAQQANAVNKTKEVKLTNAELLNSTTPIPERAQFSSDEEYDRAKRESMEKNPQAPIRERFATEELYARAKNEWIEKNRAAYEALSTEKPAALIKIEAK